jgi:hypothetical protein
LLPWLEIDKFEFFDQYDASTEMPKAEAISVWETPVSRI